MPMKGVFKMRIPDPRHAENVRAAEDALRWMRDARAEPALLEKVERAAQRRSRRFAATVGALAAVAVGAWIGLDANGFLPWRASQVEAPTAKVFEPRREALPDGSVAVLRPDAELAVEFTPRERRVVLRRGEIHFSVVKDASRPFVVVASGVEVRAVGTSFSVGLGAAAIDVVVTSGRVEVLKAATAMPARLVDASHRATLPTSADVIEVEALSPADVAERLAWRTPRIEFSRTPLAEAVSLINLRSEGRAAVHLVMDPSDEALRELRLSGFLAADNVEGFLLLLEGSFGIRAERVDGHTLRLRAAP